MKYFLGFLISVGLIIAVIILIVKGFGGKTEVTLPTPLNTYANTQTIMEMTVDGPIVAEQQHYAYRVTIGKDETRIDTLLGYEYQLIDTRTYANNTNSYENFLRALDLAGYTKSAKNATDNTDERGACATGSRYIFKITDGTKDKQRLWTTTCKDGNFKGNAGQTKKLFDAQIPTRDFRALINNISI